MKKIFTAAALSLFSLIAFAKQGGKVDVTIGDEQQKPLEGIFVELMAAKDSAMVQYTVSGADGNAEFVNIKQGDYRVYISQTGYTNYFSPVFAIDNQHLTLVLSPITLQAKSLKEVTVAVKVPAIQHYADKTVVNVQNSPLNSVGSAFDVIQRSPGVMVDQNDNISMQGKPNVSVMIDGRITPMSGSELANLLKSMSAESVDKIEFITNPSAKYDAEGSAGIINIILKKDKRMGANATVNAGYSQGIYPKSNDGFGFNKRTKKLNIFGSYNYSYVGNVNAINFDTKFYNGSQFMSSTKQTEYLKTPRTSNSGRLGTDFFASDKTTVGFIADASVNKFVPEGSTTTYEYDSLGNEQAYNITNSKSPSNTYNYDLNLNMKHRFDSAGRELLVNADYAIFNTFNYENITTNYYDTYGNAAGASNLYGSLPSALTIYSLKTDYDGKLGKKGTLEAGAKSSYVSNNNDVHIYDGISSSAPVDTGQSNHFVYTENINAAYITYNRDIRKANIQLGVRAEQTIANGNQLTTGQTFLRNFIQLFPNLSVNDSLSANNQIGLSVSRRIDRPTYSQLNPFSLYINSTFYLNGNPYLLPQDAYQVQLSDALKQKYFFTLGYTRTQHPITTEIEPYEGRPNIVKQTEENLDYNDNYALNISVSTQITNWWTTTSSLDAYVSHYSANIASTTLSTNKFLWDVNTDNNITLFKKINLDINSYYFSGLDWGYTYLDPQWVLSAGLQFKVFKKKGVIKVNANDIFWTQWTNGATNFNGFTESVFVRRDTRAIGIAFTYHFGGSAQSSLRSKGGAEEEKQRAGATG